MILGMLRTAGISAAFPTEVEVDFGALGEGLIAIVGDNGVGKTTLLELSSVGTLFRRLPSYEEGLGTHLHPAADQAHSELTFTLSGHEYRCRVQIDPRFSGGKGKTEAWLWRDGAPIAGERVTEVDRALVDILPPLELLLASNFACQSRAGSFFDQTKAARKDLFIGMLGLAQLQRLAEAAAGRAKDVVGRLDAVRAEIIPAQARLERAATLAEQIAGAEAAVAELARRLGAARTEHSAAVARLGTEREALARAETTAMEASRRKTQLASDRDAASEALAEASTRVLGFEAQLAEADAVRRAADRVGAIDLDDANLVAEVERLRTTRAPLDTEHGELTVRLETLRAEYARLTAEQKAAQAAADRVTAAGDVDAHAEGARVERNRCAEAVDSATDAIAELEEAAENERSVVAQTSTLKARRKDLEARTPILKQIDVQHPMCSVCPLVGDARATVSTLDAIDVDLAALPVIEGAPAADAMRAHQEQLTALRRAHQAAIAAVGTAEAAVAVLAADRAAAGKRSTIDEQVAANIQAGKTAKSRLEVVAAAREELQSALDACAAQRATLAGERAPIAPLAARLVEVKTAEAQIEQALLDKDKAAERLTTLTQEHDAIQLRCLAPEQDAVAAAATSAQKLADDVAALEAEHRPAAEALQRAIGERDALGDVGTALAGLRTRETELQTAAAEWAHLERAFGREGIQALEVDAAGPAVTTIANDLLSSCYGSRFQLRIDTTEPSKSKKGQMKEIFDVAILDGEAGREGKRGSGGEMVIVETALRLALAIYNSQRSGCLVETLWLDELTGALSPENATRYVQMLRRARAIGSFHQVVMISHLPQVWQQSDSQLFVAGGRVSTTPFDPAHQEAA